MLKDGRGGAERPSGRAVSCKRFWSAAGEAAELPFRRRPQLPFRPFTGKANPKGKYEGKVLTFACSPHSPFFRIFFSFFLSLSLRNLKYINYDFYIMRKIKFLMVKLQGLIIHFEIWFCGNLHLEPFNFVSNTFFNIYFYVK